MAEKHVNEKATTRGRRFAPEVLTPDEVWRLLDACGSGPASVRNRALIAVLYRSGLRITEALSLYPKDVDLERDSGGAIRVLRGKGGRSRLVGLDGGAIAMLKQWLDQRGFRGWNGTHALFCLRDGRPMPSSYVRVLLPRLGRKAGIEKRVHAHGLRHTHAAELRSEGVDVGIISKQLGHRSIATTARYLDHIAPYAVVEAIGARSW